MKPLKELTRPNIWALKPYSSARDEYSGKEASILLAVYRCSNKTIPNSLLLRCITNYIQLQVLGSGYHFFIYSRKSSYELI